MQMHLHSQQDEYKVATSFHSRDVTYGSVLHYLDAYIHTMFVFAVGT